MNMVVGIIGAFIGSYIFLKMGILATGLLGLLIAAIVGAIVLIIVFSLIRKISK